MEKIVLTAFINLLVERGLPLILTKLQELKSGLQPQLNDLKGNLSIIQAILGNAEERQLKEKPLRVWLDQLRMVAYDANDLLDECATEVLRHQVIPMKEVRNFLCEWNPRRIMFKQNISQRLTKILENLDKIKVMGQAFGLISRTEVAGSVLDQTTSLSPSSVVGRHNDKKKLVQLLVNSPRETGLSVIPVLGMSGIGKTTLAQYVYNDHAVAKHFKLKFWVHVSYDLNMKKITNAMAESFNSQISSLSNLDSVQNLLCRELRKRAYLLVLDGVCNVSPHEWEKLKPLLLYGAKGSRILVTTTSQEVAKFMGTMPPHHLQGLLDDECLSLFCLHALCTKDYMSSDVDVARKVVDKCKGLPFMAQLIGFRLRKESDRSKWGAILRDEMWDFSGGEGHILCSLKFNYGHFPAHLKACFAYCSIFPKGFRFDKDELVQLWMAQNFIQEGSTERIEDVGLQYFNYLLQSSFFQDSHFDYKRKRPKYTMADHIHQFAQSVVGESCIMEIGRPSNISETTRHCSLVHQPFASTNSRSRSSSGQKGTIERIYQCKSLYTLLIVSVAEPIGMDVPGLLAKNLSRLRALDLSNSGVSEVPESIGDLKHLRYLQLRNTNIKRLPNSVGELYNLQTLGLGNCYYLEELPQHTKRLHQLRHLDLHLDDDLSLKHPQTYGLRSMPPNIGELTHLQTLSRFVISRKKILSRCGIGELRNLDNLYGQLHISNLHLILNETEAMDAKLNCKKHLSQLEMRWNHGISSSHPHDENVEYKVIQALEPHPNLKELTIIDYRGASFPSWITGKSDFNNLVTLVLKDCSRTEVLPQLGHLPKLKDLHIEGMHGVTVVDCAFCGHKKFPALKKLHFERMRNLKVWRGDKNCILPSLRKLVIKECINLCQLDHRLPLNCLEELEIESCDRLSSLPAYGLPTSLQFLSINDCPALGKRCQDTQGEDWRKIAHIASVWINGLEVASASHSSRF